MDPVIQSSGHPIGPDNASIASTADLARVPPRPLDPLRRDNRVANALSVTLAGAMLTVPILVGLDCC